MTANYTYGTPTVYNHVAALSHTVPLPACTKDDIILLFMSGPGANAFITPSFDGDGSENHSLAGDGWSDAWMGVCWPVGRFNSEGTPPTTMTVTFSGVQPWALTCVAVTVSKPVDAAFPGYWDIINTGTDVARGRGTTFSVDPPARVVDEYYTSQGGSGWHWGSAIAMCLTDYNGPTVDTLPSTPAGWHLAGQGEHTTTGFLARLGAYYSDDIPITSTTDDSFPTFLSGTDWFDVATVAYAWVPFPSDSGDAGFDEWWDVLDGTVSDAADTAAAIPLALGELSDVNDDVPTAPTTQDIIVYDHVADEWTRDSVVDGGAP